MNNAIKVFAGQEACRKGTCSRCPYDDVSEDTEVCKEALEKDEKAIENELNELYSHICVRWLEGLANSCVGDTRRMSFHTAVKEVKDRAERGLKNFMSYTDKKGLSEWLKHTVTDAEKN